MAESEIRTPQFSLSEHDVLTGWNIHARKDPLLGRVVYACTTLLVAVSVASPFILVAYTVEAQAGSLAWWVITTLTNLRCLIWPLAGFVVLQFVMHPFITRRNLRQSYAASQELCRNIELVLNDTGIDVIRPGSRSHFDWSWYKSAIESREYYLVSYAGNLLMIPKKALAPDQVPQVAEMLRSHIGQYEFRDR